MRDVPPGFKPTPGATVQARVLGQDAQGHLLLRTTNGVFAVATSAKPATGSQVALQFRTVGGQVQAYIVGPRLGDPDAKVLAAQPEKTETSAAFRSGTASPASVTEGANALTRTWPALDEAIAAFKNTPGGHPGALALLLGRLPQQGSGLASTLLFLIAALNRGSARTWLGADPLAALIKMGRGDLATRLENDFAQLNRFAQSDEENWRLYVLPLLIDGETRALRLFTHAPPASETRDAAHRAVVEVELPHLGQLQLDVLVRAWRLDMILRSREELGSHLQSQIDRIVQHALAAGHITGGISFAPGQEWRFLDLPDRGEAPHGLTV